MLKLANFRRVHEGRPNCDGDKHFGSKILLTYREVCLFSEPNVPQQAVVCVSPPVE